MKNFSQLKKNLKKDFSEFKKVKAAVLGDSATQLFAQAIRGQGYENQIDINIFEGDYDQIERQICDASSELYAYRPEFIIIFFSSYHVLKRFYHADFERKSSFADDFLQMLRQYQDNIASACSAKIICLNLPLINDAVFGNYANNVSGSFIYQLRKLNAGIADLAQNYKNFFVCDLCLLSGEYGQQYFFDARIYVTADMVLSLDALPIVAKNIVDMMQACLGKFKKCLILDCDNTLWGGVVGDDGMENIELGDLGIGKVFTEFQLWCKQLKERGIILAVCSKNDEATAKEPFEKHPEMVLKLDDIALFVANWENKVDNIKYIQQVLNIGFDSMVFIDDNPFERDMLKTYLPEICVPEIPADPAEYLLFLRQCNLFETASFVEGDKNRTHHYQQEVRRQAVKIAFGNEDEYLSSLQMRAVVHPFDAFSIPRVAQLTQRSNQFNLRTVRYSQAEITDIAASRDYATLAFSLSDKFGDYGLVSIVILKKEDGGLFIDTWIMSCRVLKRGLEHFVLHEIVGLALKNKMKRVRGEYVPTLKNNLVKNHYADLGFKKNKSDWILEADKYSIKKTFIDKVDPCSLAK